MDPDAVLALEQWVKTLPGSRMVFPPSFRNRLKYFFWRLYTPFHPFFRDTGLLFGIVRHEARQDCLLGMIAPDITIRQFVSFLVDRGYANHFIAWKDPGEVVSLRLVEDFAFQYHLRLFEDGEVRGHYEHTPESHPIRHMRERGFEHRREYFLRLLGDRIVPVSTTIS